MRIRRISSELCDRARAPFRRNMRGPIEPTDRVERDPPQGHAATLHRRPVGYSHDVRHGGLACLSEPQLSSGESAGDDRLPARLPEVEDRTCIKDRRPTSPPVRLPLFERTVAQFYLSSGQAGRHRCSASITLSAIDPAICDFSNSCPAIGDRFSRPLSERAHWAMQTSLHNNITNARAFIVFTQHQ